MFAVTKFQEKVYNVVKEIKRGETLTYAQVARVVGSPRAARAVGNALNKNTNPSIPCHRVIKSNGGTGGYNKGAKLKIKLLESEGVIKLNPRSRFNKI